MALARLLCAIAVLIDLSSGYVEFGELTSPATVVRPTFTVPQPHQLPTDMSMQFASQHSMITAIAPSVTVVANGSFHTSWSIHYLEPDRRNIRMKGGVFRRQGVFSNATSLFATCTPCTNAVTGTAAGQCHVLTYSGVFRAGYTTSPTGSLCYAPSYAGALLPLSTFSLPCCPSCTPPVKTSAPITTGVLATNGSIPAGPTNVSTNRSPSGTSVSTSGRSLVTGQTSATESLSSGPSETVTITVVTSITTTVPKSSFSTETILFTFPTVISNSTTIISTKATIVVPVPIPTSTLTDIESSSSPDSHVTLGVSTVTPTSAPIGETPITLVQPAKVSGCGTASGSGTIVGSGTVYVGPYGLIPVISSGTVSGFASTVIGCGSIIATSGVFIGTASITGCGEGNGFATLVGSGTVYPAIFRGLISVVSSGTVTGSGRVVGCGSLIGTGTFTVKSLYTTTITPSPRPTVNVYISYCPAEPVWRIGSNFSAIEGGQSSADQTGKYFNSTYQPAVPTPYPLLNISSVALFNHTTSNSTSNSTLINPFCQMCPNDAGICCPLTVACGADGHCPYTALQGCGYILFGTNIVDYRNSSTSIGMVVAPWKVAPGLPGEETGLVGLSKRNVVRRQKHKHKNKSKRKDH